MITSNQPRHRWLVHSLQAQVGHQGSIVGIVSEAKTDFYSKISQRFPTLRKHFQLNRLYERLYFGNKKFPSEVPLLKLSYGEINNSEVVQWVAEKNPHFLLLFGTGILKHGWFQSFSDRIINLHLGLAPYYRGSGTNFWPLVNREPQYVGATILVADQGVDSGRVIRHVIPDIALEDSPYDIGMKIIRQSIQLLFKTAVHYMSNRKAIPQSEIGVDVPIRRYYRRRDLTEQAVVTLWRNWNLGMLGDYLEYPEKFGVQPEIITVAD